MTAKVSRSSWSGRSAQQMPRFSTRPTPKGGVTTPTPRPRCDAPLGVGYQRQEGRHQAQPQHARALAPPHPRLDRGCFCSFFFTLGTGPRRSLSLGCTHEWLHGMEVGGGALGGEQDPPLHPSQVVVVEEVSISLPLSSEYDMRQSRPDQCEGHLVHLGRGCQPRCAYRGTSLTRDTPLLGPYSRTMPRVLWWS